MDTFWFLLLCVLAAIPLLASVKDPERIFEYPAFMAFAFVVYVIPQAISLMRFPGAIQDESVTAVPAMSCLCLAACLLGYRLAPSRLAIALASRPIDLGRLFHAGLLFVFIGIAASATMSRIEVQYAETTGGMTGSGTIVLFFRQLALPGFAITLFSALRRPSVPTIVATLIALATPLTDVVVGRRENAAILFLTIVMALYYERRRKPSRVAIASMLVFSMLAIPATHEYRQYAGSNRLDEIGNIDLVGNFERFISQESILELRNAAAVIESTRTTANYEFGAGYWNHLVFRYVPAQFVGEGFKAALMLPGWERSRSETTEMGFRFARGSTVTGMGDTFGQFGWFGCLYFALMAVLFKGMWQASLGRDALFARLLYIMSFTSGMRAVTHWTLDFLPGLIYFLIFLGLAGFYAAVQRPDTGSARSKNRLRMRNRGNVATLDRSRA